MNLPDGATEKDGRIYNSHAELIEVFEGRWRVVKDGVTSAPHEGHSLGHSKVSHVELQRFAVSARFANRRANNRKSAPMKSAAEVLADIDNLLASEGYESGRDDQGSDHEKVYSAAFDFVCDWQKTKTGEFRDEIERLTAENERLRAALLEIASQNKWSEIALDSQGAHTGLVIVNEMQTIARRALHPQATP